MNYVIDIIKDWKNLLVQLVFLNQLNLKYLKITLLYLKKVRKGNYVKVNDKYMAPFNEQEQRIAMRNNSSINIYWSLSSKMEKPYIKFGSNKCYLKEIDILTDWFDVNELDPATYMMNRINHI